MNGWSSAAVFQLKMDLMALRVSLKLAILYFAAKKQLFQLQKNKISAISVESVQAGQTDDGRKRGIPKTLSVPMAGAGFFQEEEQEPNVIRGLILTLSLHLEL